MNNAHAIIRIINSKGETFMTMEEMFKAFTSHRAPSTVIEVVSGLRLPQDYLEFMRVHNGDEGAIGENGYFFAHDQIFRNVF